MPVSLVGPLIREARVASRRSQLDLASEVGISPRHLSFVELGKSRPSPEVLDLLAGRLGVSLRERNRWLIAAGHAPRHAHTPFEAPGLTLVRDALTTVIEAHDPWPAVVVDGGWSVQLSNRAAVWLADGIPIEARGVPTNIFRVCLHPNGFASRTTNFPEWSSYLLRELDRAVTVSPNGALTELAVEVAGWPSIPPRETWSTLDPGSSWPAVPWRIERDGVPLAFWSVMSTFATPNDVTLAELAIEVFLPADDHTALALRAIR